MCGFVSQEIKGHRRAGGGKQQGALATDGQELIPRQGPEGMSSDNPRI